jgi:type IV pilus assembly protein PilX
MMPDHVQNQTSAPLRRRESGAVLVISLLFLVILTILGITAMWGSISEEKMSGNARDMNLAFQAAESALRDARRDINGIVIPASGAAARSPGISGASGFGSPVGTAGTCSTTGLCYPSAAGPTPPLLNVSLSAAPGVTYGTYSGMPAVTGVGAQPRYIIEVLCLPVGGGTIGGNNADFCNFYRITARGYGQSTNTQVTLQEVYLRP